MLSLFWKISFLTFFKYICNVCDDTTQMANHYFILFVILYKFCVHTFLRVNIYPYHLNRRGLLFPGSFTWVILKSVHSLWIKKNKFMINLFTSIRNSCLTWSSLLNRIFWWLPFAMLRSSLVAAGCLYIFCLRSSRHDLATFNLLCETVRRSRWGRVGQSPGP